MDLDGHLLWDNHTYCAPEPGTATIEQLDRHRRAGFSVAFLNLGDGGPDAALMADHIDHVGIGTDYGYMSAAVIGDVVGCLEGKGYGPADIAKVLGGNMRRLAAAVWR